MKFNIHAGMRVLYKENGQWKVGTLQEGDALIDDTGVYLPVIGKESYVELNDFYFESFKIEDWFKDYSNYFMTKEQYINFVESEEFIKAAENAYVSDGEYGYYPISKYTRNWIEKQPFDYVVRGEK